MKRMTAFLLALVVAISCFTISAFAGSETFTGTYNGYGYTASGSVSSNSLYVYLSYNNANTILKILGYYNYMDTNNVVHTMPIIVKGNSAINQSPAPTNFHHFTSADPDYYINGALVISFTLSA